MITPLMPTYNRADLAFAICHMIGIRSVATPLVDSASPAAA